MHTEKKHIIIAVTGSIASYRSCELVRELTKKGYPVTVLMTENASRFVGPVTFQSLSSRKVYHGNFSEEMEHIDIKNLAGVFCVAPATANMIGKMANGIADDLISTSYLAVNCPVIAAPAMNPQMYASKPVQRNLEILKQDGVHIIEPVHGTVVCGDTGQGKLADLEIIEKEILKFYNTSLNEN
ncbi:MAG: phosphopantothenoylcysteine decarboxylase [Spirochaetia bacterium]|nr:phosphopantothenoylcysteine decarboxylase [Spirochaetia bacterium]